MRRWRTSRLVSAPNALHAEALWLTLETAEAVDDYDLSTGGGGSAERAAEILAVGSQPGRRAEVQRRLYSGIGVKFLHRLRT